MSLDSKHQAGVAARMSGVLSQTDRRMQLTGLFKDYQLVSWNRPYGLWITEISTPSQSGTGNASNSETGVPQPTSTQMLAYPCLCGRVK